ncbi:GNAT family N-acetyltransferase [uncultured Draconibacterium sp.]|uniref:GNAT family N-acetyltransferase n=1 Tax=uncultured Draconibacterium sp. TaxID=1573823 RepID=UPI0025ED83F2|nr:GNAT family N-acetyltransferase [uncultured Draconibacterium sp.]
MQFRTLENLLPETLSSLFNAAFADYFVSIQLTPEALQQKMYSEAISLKHSVGVFANDKPVGFIFHAIRGNKTKRAYNAGTGVIPEFRGKHATARMYKFILPRLQKAGVEELELEVMKQNEAAIKSYTSVGFCIENELHCFKGFPTNSVQKNNFLVEEYQGAFQTPETFWDWQPTWQHTTQTIEKLSTYKTWVIHHQNKLVGYLSANPGSGRIAQFSVDKTHRRSGIGTALFSHFSGVCKNEPAVINVADSSGATQQFLQALGLHHFLTQYKMKLKL